MSEKYYDKQLHIQTCGDQMNYNGSLHYNRYEPTPYVALERLYSKYELESSDRVVDFGCGKGRINLFTHYRFESTVIGVEMDENFYKEAMENRKSYLKKYNNRHDSIHFLNCTAEEYEIHPEDNKFYFFNPFSNQIFMKIVNRILVSVEESPREVDIILYYPSEHYIYFLENQTNFVMIEEINLSDLYKNDSDERFLIYRLSV